MPHYSITKRIEPYVLLEMLKSHYEMNDYTFDGFSKLDIKDKFLKELNKENTFGLYMKNVNKFYVFQGSQTFEPDKFFELKAIDFETTYDFNVPLDKVDYGKAEAAIIIF